MSALDLRKILQPRPKVLFVAEESDPLGPVATLLRVLPRLGEDRIAASVMFRHDGGPMALSLQHEGAVVHELGDPGPPAARRGFVSTTIAVHRLAAFMRELAPEIAHGLDEPSSRLLGIAGRIAGVPNLVGTWNTHGSKASWTAAAAWRRLDRIVVPSEAVKSEVAPFIRGRAADVAVIPEGIDAREVRGCARAPEFSEPRLRVGTILRLTDGCGLGDLIEAAVLLESRIPDVEWLVSGGGRDALAFLRETQRRGLESRVRLLGVREDPGAFLASVDAFVAPGGREAFSAGLMQALAAGVPCVAARNPTLDLALTDGRDALLVAPGDPEALAGAVLRILSDERGDLRSRLRSAGPGVADRFSSDSTASAFFALYESLLNAASRK